jgi:hypothetical protein
MDNAPPPRKDAEDIGKRDDLFPHSLPLAPLRLVFSQSRDEARYGKISISTGSRFRCPKLAGRWAGAGRLLVRNLVPPFLHLFLGGSEEAEKNVEFLCNAR